MRTSFDTNAWETVFEEGDTRHAPIRNTLLARTVEGFICAASFRIEAIRKKSRPGYFAQPHMEANFGPSPNGRGGVGVAGSIGPDNAMHPGLPPIQAGKLQRARAAGIKLMFGLNWMGLPEPLEIQDRSFYVQESPDESHAREERQLWAAADVDGRGVGYAAFEKAGGWKIRPRSPAEDKQLAKACAEWADGELVEAHIAYRNDVLCTNDFARSSGHSIFDATNRTWLAQRYGVTFMTLDDLIAKIP